MFIRFCFLLRQPRKNEARTSNTASLLLLLLLLLREQPFGSKQAPHQRRRHLLAGQPAFLLRHARFSLFAAEARKKKMAGLAVRPREKEEGSFEGEVNFERIKQQFAPQPKGSMLFGERDILFKELPKSIQTSWV